MIAIVISVLMALLVVTVPSWWSTRERGRARAPREWLLVAAARLWLGTRRRPETALRRFARPVVAAALAQATRIDGDARLMLPRRLTVQAHRDDVALLAQHVDELADEVAAVLRLDLGLLVVPGRPVLWIGTDPTVLPGRPHVRPAPPIGPKGTAPPPAVLRLRESHPFVVPEPAATAVIPTSDLLTVGITEDQPCRSLLPRPSMEDQTAVVRRR